jgi:hypothetical protein
VPRRRALTHPSPRSAMAARSFARSSPVQPQAPTRDIRHGHGRGS